MHSDVHSSSSRRLSPTLGSSSTSKMEHQAHHERRPELKHVDTDLLHVREAVDARLTPASRPSNSDLEEGLAHQFVHAFGQKHDLHHTSRSSRELPKETTEELAEKHLSVVPAGKTSEASTTRSVEPSTTESEEIIYVEWAENDPRNPANFSNARKWVITFVACAFTGLSASAASTYALGYPSMTRDLSCTTFQATIGLSLYALGFGLVPLVTASLSEEFGRQPLYIVSSFIFLMMHLGVALAQNIQSVLIFRFIAGGAGSTGATMVGGTISDIWASNRRGIPMAVYSMAAIGGTGLGPVMAGYIEMNQSLGWRWIQWLHLIVTGILFFSILVGLKETRSGVLLTKLARKIRKETGDHRHRARIEDERGSLKNLILLSCTRPLHLLITEPVVASFSLWIGFAWGILYSLIESIAPAFQQLHQFNQGETGLAFVTLVIGSFLGLLSNMYQERLYRENVKQRGHEARLYLACAAGFLFPIALFIYAWTSFEKLSWVGMAVGVTLFMWATFVMYLAVFTYLADCYGPFASSALAGQSLCRNLMGFAFPLFTQQMFKTLTFPWSSTLFACIACLMAPIPFVLFRWGPQIRARSKFAKMVMGFKA